MVRSSSFCVIPPYIPLFFCNLEHPHLVGRHTEKDPHQAALCDPLLRDNFRRARLVQVFQIIAAERLTSAELHPFMQDTAAFLIHDPLPDPVFLLLLLSAITLVLSPLSGALSVLQGTEKKRQLSLGKASIAHFI